jgi:hypothetical protein
MRVLGLCEDRRYLLGNEWEVIADVVSVVPNAGGWEGYVLCVRVIDPGDYANMGGVPAAANEVTLPEGFFYLVHDAPPHVFFDDVDGLLRKAYVINNDVPV